MLPDSRSANPYQTLLSNALEQLDVQVRFTNGYRRVLPLTRDVRSAHPRPDVLHLHWVSPFLRRHGWLGFRSYATKLLLDVALVRASGVRIVWTIHNLNPHESYHPAVEKWLYRRLAKLVDGIIVHDEDARTAAIRRLKIDPAKIHEIPHGHYRDAYGPALAKPAAREQLGIPQDAFVYLFLGLLRPYKGIEDLLQQWAACRARLGERALLIIAGMSLNPAYGERIAALARGTPDVRLEHRFVEDAELPVFYGAADVAVLPFRQITTSGSLMLAMSYDTPVIAPCFGHVGGQLGDAGALTYTVEAGAEGLGARLVEARLSTDLESLRRKVHIAADAFDWTEIARQTRQVYEPGA